MSIPCKRKKNGTTSVKFSPSKALKVINEIPIKVDVVL